MSTVLRRSNRGGVPCLKSVNTVVTGETLTVTFPEYINWPNHFSGVMILNISQPFTASDISTVNLVIQGETAKLLTHSGSAAGEAQITGPGIYKVFVDNEAKSIYVI